MTTEHHEPTLNADSGWSIARLVDGGDDLSAPSLPQRRQGILGLYDQIKGYVSPAPTPEVVPPLDSRPQLEEMGFTILGYTEHHYRTLPPRGFKHRLALLSDEANGTMALEFFDSAGAKRLRQVYRNDRWQNLTIY